MKKTIGEMLLLEGIILSNLSEGVLRKLQTLRLGSSESFSFTQDDLLEMRIHYTLPTAENVMDNVLTACRLFKNDGKRLIDLIISNDGNYNIYPNNYFYYTDNELDKDITLEPIKKALEAFQSSTPLNYGYSAYLADESSVEDIKRLMPKNSYLFFKVKNEFDKLAGTNASYNFILKVIAGLNLVNKEVK
ncbi:hypothetical protein [Carnobacterium pleistocenium]|uniref:hypothetical protein n=1 Tax=Carnobacterium pleistocenium TaxID=181073 RepID=UPI00054CFE83|nr:hypothetical protein [Carnobacterium pleistocenium]